MTSNFELLEMAKMHNINNFMVCMNDELKTYKYPTNGYFILNLQDSNHDGTHWSCLVIKDNIPCYFDSYGGIYSEDVEKYIKKNYGKKCSFNAKVIQSFKSVECGIFCFALILYIENHPHLDILQSVNEYTNIFSDDPNNNDKILHKLMKILQTKK